MGLGAGGGRRVCVTCCYTHTMQPTTPEAVGGWGNKTTYYSAAAEERKEKEFKPSESVNSE